MLEDKTIHQLRAIAQGFDIPDIFSKDRNQLVQAIELKRDKMIPEPSLTVPKPEYDARLMTAEPNAIVDQAELGRMLEPYISRGMHVDFPDEESFEFRFANKSDTGNLRQPLRAILQCADRVMK